MHPEFETAYALRPVSAGAPAFPRERLRVLFGAGGPRRLAVADRLAASIVVTRTAGMVDLPATAVVTVASRTAGGLRVLDHRWAEAADEAVLVAGLKRFVEKTWPCESVLVRVRTSRDDGQVRDLLQQSLQQGGVRWIPETAQQRERESSAVIAAALTGRVGLYAPDGSPEYRALRREMEWAVLRVGEGSGFTVAVEGQDEGFLEGISMLASEDAEQAGEQQMAFPMAIAS
jgi:hypothetical protein